MIREAIADLVEGRVFDAEAAHRVISEIMSGEATSAQIAAFITALRMRGESGEVIAGCARAMREYSSPVPHRAEIVVDTCGTGGDGARTFNISTASALVAAGAGATVAKHGNRSVSSRCGSADVLDALGVALQLPPPALGECLDRIGIAFLFAPNLHPAMRFAIGPRREIGIRSIFNILGPLSNPAGAAYGVMGVFSADMVRPMAEAAAALGARRMFVVHGLDGLDEITLTGPTLIGEAREGTVDVYEWTPEDFGLPRCRPEDLAGGEPEEGARILRAILNGAPGPCRAVVLANAAAALIAAGIAPTPAEGVERAAQAIDSGAALAKLEVLIETTHALARPS
jgi:anthranilate phosphoribosyltransferase